MINWWQVWTIVLACACACLFVATGLALYLMYRYKAENEQLHLKKGGLLKSIADQAERNALTLEAYAALQSRCDTLSQANERLTSASMTGEIKQSRTRQKPLARTE